ncbi:hypothetical protein PIB30_032940 [Stylosanthes scabra]|uniref:Uncharacterized protein n=1 Tax=Stylosanthes scabra TaxID=79078 RepID=A0ABU6XAG5_9FABA|nr:hypothetical protein [Stylosanthes scabra]
MSLNYRSKLKDISSDNKLHRNLSVPMEVDEVESQRCEKHALSRSRNIKDREKQAGSSKLNCIQQQGKVFALNAKDVIPSDTFIQGDRDICGTRELLIHSFRVMLCNILVWCQLLKSLDWLFKNRVFLDCFCKVTLLLPSDLYTPLPSPVRSGVHNKPSAGIRTCIGGTLPHVTFGISRVGGSVGIVIGEELHSS